MNNFPIELQHLITLKTLSETGTLSRTAKILHLTQPAISHQIKMIEDFYGFRLYERKSSPVLFSAAGHRLLDLANAVLPLIQQAATDLKQMVHQQRGSLRISVECHTCFDWLLPSMDTFRGRWPDVELDILSGFQDDPVSLLLQNRADLAILSDYEKESGIDHFPLFSFEIVALMSNDHPLTAKSRLDATDFAEVTLITYPIPDEMIDVIRKVLKPAGITPKKRTSQLTMAILQLVASGRGIAALPLWAVRPYLEKNYVTSRPIGPSGLTGDLYTAVRSQDSGGAYLRDFVDIMRNTGFTQLPGITLLEE